MSRFRRFYDFLTTDSCTMAALSGLFLIYCYLSYDLIGLNFEGSQWFFTFIDNVELVTKNNGFRHSDTFWQILPYLLLKLYQFESPTVPLYLLSFIYMLLPFISLFACYYIIRKQKENYIYLVFPALSIVAASTSSITFSVGIANGTIAFFWPLLFAINFRYYFTFKLATLCYLLSFGLFFGYEPALILSCAVAFKCYTKKTKNVTQQWFLKSLFMVNVTSVIFQLYKVFEPTINTDSYRQVFFMDMAQLFDKNISFFGYVCAIIILLLLAATIIPKKFKTTILYIQIISVLSIFSWVTFYQTPGLMEARKYRTIAVPIAFLIAIIFFAFNNKLENTKSEFKFLKLMLILLTISSYFYLLGLDSTWTKYTSTLKNFLKEKSGCIQLNTDIASSTDTYLSLLLQKTFKSEKIFFTYSKRCRLRNSDCQMTKNSNVYISNPCTNVYINPYNFDLQKTYQKNTVLEEMTLFNEYR